QIRDSGASAPANISEGFGRYVPRDFANYLRIAKGSLNETRNHLIDARDRGYLRDPLLSRLMNLTRAAERVTTGLLLQKLRPGRNDAADGHQKRPRHRKVDGGNRPAGNRQRSTRDRTRS